MNQHVHWPESPIVRTAAEGMLLCPHCGDASVHIERVQIAARPREDGPLNEITVDAVTGAISTHGSSPAPTGHLGEGRRHRIALSGYCEPGGHEFALVLTQHKGDTFVEWAETTSAVDPRR